jgi:hypothetical protein
MRPFNNWRAIHAQYVTARVLVRNLVELRPRRGADARKKEREQHSGHGLHSYSTPAE